MATKSLADLQKDALTFEVPDETDFLYASNTGAAAAAVSASLPAVATKTNYILGFTVTTANPAAVVNGVVTVTGLGVTLNFQFVQAVATGGKLVVNFPSPLPSNAVNTAIVVTLPAIVGGAVGAVTVIGFAR